MFAILILKDFESILWLQRGQVVSIQGMREIAALAGNQTRHEDPDPCQDHFVNPDLGPPPLYPAQHTPHSSCITGSNSVSKRFSSSTICSSPSSFKEAQQ